MSRRQAISLSSIWAARWRISFSRSGTVDCAVAGCDQLAARSVARTAERRGRHNVVLHQGRPSHWWRSSDRNDAVVHHSKTAHPNGREPESSARFLFSVISTDRRYTFESCQMRRYAHGCTDLVHAEAEG